MTTPRKLIILCLISTLPLIKIKAQDTGARSFINEIQARDLSSVFSADSILSEDIEGFSQKIMRPSALGFIGDDYQRFNIHFNSVVKSLMNPYEYIISGKTKVRDNICHFNGIITIREAQIHNSPLIPAYKQGSIRCEVVIYEDKHLSATGYIKGILTSNFVIDDKSHLRYDAINSASDNFRNNQFTGIWTSYKTKVSKKCNWGDYRIPECGDLDIGAGEFSVNDKYLNKGWETYRLATSGECEKTKDQNEALIKENEAWWK